MNVKIKHLKEWTKNRNISFRGYFQIGDEYHIYQGEESINIVQNIASYDDFMQFLRKLHGCYAIVIKMKDCIWAATDIARSIPLYYSIDNQCISDSAEYIRGELGISKDDVDQDKIVELYANYYLFGHDTAYSQIKQLDLGEAVEFSPSGIRTEKYYHHLAPVVDAPVPELKERLNKAAYHAFERIKAAIGDRPVVLSMSGGYDSRFVGCMLKNVGVKDVSCYTYGKLDSFEVKQSKKNAEALGFRWACAEMTDEDVVKTLDEVGQKYFDSYCGHDFTAYVQNFPAVRKLHELGYFKPGSVFLTGLCGDMPTGTYILPYDSNFIYNSQAAADRLYELIFNRYDLSASHRERWIQNIKDEIVRLPIEVKDYQSWVSAVDCIYTGSCHAHWFMHMNSVHSFFGYEWLLPYWDKELLSAWYSIPVDKRINQRLYQDWLLNDICAPYSIGQRKIISKYTNKKLQRKLLYFVGGIVNYIFLHCGKVFRRKSDFNNFAPLELKLFQRIKDKSIINYRRSGFMQLLEYFLFEKRYGSENIKQMISHLKSKE